MSDLPNFDDAVILLKNILKDSNINNQKHLDLTLANASDRIKYQKALMIVQSAVSRGEIDQSTVNG